MMSREISIKNSTRSQPINMIKITNISDKNINEYDFEEDDADFSSDFKYELGLSKLPIGNTPPESEVIKLILKQQVYKNYLDRKKFN